MISDTLPPLLLRALPLLSLRAAGVAILVMGTLRTEIASALHASQRHKGVSLRAAGVAISVMGTLRTEIASALHASQRHKGVLLRAAGVAISVKDTFIL